MCSSCNLLVTNTKRLYFFHALSVPVSPCLNLFHVLSVPVSQCLKNLTLRLRAFVFKKFYSCLRAFVFKFLLCVSVFKHLRLNVQ